MIPVIVTLEHPKLKELFPIGFVTFIKVKKIKLKNNGRWTKLNNNENFYVQSEAWVEYKLLIKATDNKIYNCDIFYRCLGKHFTKFLRKIKV